MIVHDMQEKLVAQLYVNTLLEKMKPYEIRNYIDSLSQEELLKEIDHDNFKLDKYELHLECFVKAFNSMWRYRYDI